MAKKQIATPNAPSAIGPYSQAVEAGNMVFVSGQIALDPQSGEVVPGNIEVQAKRIMESLRMILMEAGCEFNNVVKSNIYLTDLNDFAKVNEIYGSYFKEPYPARATVEVSSLPKGVALEIDVIAVKD